MQPVKLREPFDGWTLDIAPDANNKHKNRSPVMRDAAWDPDRGRRALGIAIHSAYVAGIDWQWALCTMPKISMIPRA